MVSYTLSGGLPGGASGKEPTCQCSSHRRKAGSIPGSVRPPGGGHRQCTPVFLPGESHGQRTLAGCSPQGHCTESDRTEIAEHTRPYTLLGCY